MGGGGGWGGGGGEGGEVLIFGIQFSLFQVLELGNLSRSVDLIPCELLCRAQRFRMSRVGPGLHGFSGFSVVAN